MCVSLIELYDCKNLDEHSYIETRDGLRDNHQYWTKSTSINFKEKIVDVYLQIVKGKDFDQASNTYCGLEKNLKQIQNEQLYGTLKELPKGANLHIHFLQIASRRSVLEWIVNSTEYDHLCICDQDVCKEKQNNLNYFFQKPPVGWTLVKTSNWSITKIEEKTTLIGLLNDEKEPVGPSDTARRWSIASKAFACWADILQHNNTLFNYLKIVMDASKKENVQLLEIRTLPVQAWYFSSNGTKMFIAPEETMRELNTFRRTYLAVNQKMIDIVFILSTQRQPNPSNIERDLDLAMRLHGSHPDMIKGFDIVGEEDKGYSLFHFRNTLVKGFNRIQDSSKGSFNFYFHADETNWPADVNSFKTDDESNALDNIFDSLMLHTRRIGHGIGLFKYPALYEVIKERQIAIEVCPSSNALLGEMKHVSKAN